MVHHRQKLPCFCLSWTVLPFSLPGWTGPEALRPGQTEKRPRMPLSILNRLPNRPFTCVRASVALVPGGKKPRYVGPNKIVFSVKNNQKKPFCARGARVVRRRGRVKKLEYHTACRFWGVTEIPPGTPNRNLVRAPQCQPPVRPGDKRACETGQQNFVPRLGGSPWRAHSVPASIAGRTRECHKTTD